MSDGLVASFGVELVLAVVRLVGEVVGRAEVLSKATSSPRRMGFNAVLLQCPTSRQNVEMCLVEKEFDACD
jgi:hypothetical protein